MGVLPAEKSSNGMNILVASFKAVRSTGQVVFTAQPAELWS